MRSATDDEPQPQPMASRGECICRHGSEPIDGLRYICPSCPRHYAARIIARAKDGTLEAVIDWHEPVRRKKRVTYPVMPAYRGAA